MKIESFAHSSIGSMAKEINAFIRTHSKIEVVDIKFTTADLSGHFALLLYREKKDE